MKLPRLKQRKDFLQVTQKGRRCFSEAFVLQYLQQLPRSSEIVGGEKEVNPEPAWRIGFTVTKKIGSAVIRNRVKRRLRSAAEKVLPTQAKTGMAYVLVAREPAKKVAFQKLVTDLEKALQTISD